jgi:hypothetical protein
MGLNRGVYPPNPRGSIVGFTDYDGEALRVFEAD